MKIFTVVIAALFIAFTVTGCLNLRHHKKNRSVKSKQTLYVQPQPKPEVKVAVPGIVAQPEKQPVLEPAKVIPKEEVVLPGERTPEKKENEGWWFW